MRTISKSVIDPRNLSLALTGIGGTPLVIGIFSLNWILILSGIIILTTGILILFFGRSTYGVTYNNKSEKLMLTSRQENLTIDKNDVLNVEGRFSITRLIWPFPRPYFYALTVNDKLNRKRLYRFVIWSNQANLKANYKMLERSVATWTK